MTPAEQYKKPIEDAILEDNNRQNWTIEEWRQYFLEELFSTVYPSNFSIKDVLNIFGPVKGSQIASKLEQNYKYVYENMKNSEGGVDLNTDTASNFFTQLLNDNIITLSDLNRLKSKYIIKTTRASKMSLPRPRENYIRGALRLLGKIEVNGNNINVGG